MRLGQVFTSKVIKKGTMNKNVCLLFLACLLPCIAAAQGGATQGGAKGQGAGSTAGQGGQSGASGNASASALPGLSWTQASWSSELVRFPESLPNTRLVCFNLKYTFSAAQPLVLERISPPFSLKGRECDKLDENTPLMMRERLVIGIDASSVPDLTPLKLLNINITNQQGNSINPTPVRPSFAGGAPSAGPTTAEIPRGPFFIAWPDRLPGDVIPTISVNTIYTPPTPGATWHENTFYPIGSVVVPSTLNGHYYTAIKAGVSSIEPCKKTEPSKDCFWPAAPIAQVTETGTPQLTWKDETPLPPPPECGSSAKSWQAGTIYPAGNCVTSKNARFWVAVGAGTSGRGTEPFPANSSTGDSFTEVTTKLKWIDKTPTPAECSSARPWQARMYSPGECAISKNARLWVASGGNSGPMEPYPPVSSVGTSIVEGSGLRWTDRTPPLTPPPQCGGSPKSWQPNAIYAAGTCVSSLNSNLWVVTIGGVSGTGAEPFPPLSAAGESVTEQSVLTWEDAGTSAPSSPAKQWLRGAPHIVGDVITDPVTGHFYLAIQGGTSGSGNPPPFPVTPITIIKEDGIPVLVSDGSALWKAIGTSPPTRKANTLYAPGAVVFSPSNSHFYIASQASPAKSSDSDVLNFAGDTIIDGGVIWTDRSTDPKSVAWKAHTPYWESAIVYSVKKGEYYQQVSAGPQTSGPGPNEPNFPSVDSFPVIKWQDSGTTPPASVAAGQPADQSVSLLNLTLPQTHTISVYNVAFGVVYSTIRTPSFAVSGTPPATVNTGSSAIVDPVVVLTAYWLGHWFPMDAERDWRPRDLIPGLSIGLSLSSPASNFYFGGSSEFFLRNVQLTYGLSIAKVPEAAAGSNGTSPATSQHFKPGAFVGLTFNVSGFIQGLFGGGSGGKSSGQ